MTVTVCVALCFCLYAKGIDTMAVLEMEKACIWAVPPWLGPGLCHSNLRSHELLLTKTHFFKKYI